MTAWHDSRAPPDSLVSLARSKVPRDREIAADSLSQYAHPNTLNLLYELARDPKAGVQISALHSLAHVFSHGAKELEKYQENAAAVVAEKLNNSDKMVRWHAANVARHFIHYHSVVEGLQHAFLTEPKAKTQRSPEHANAQHTRCFERCRRRRQGICC